MPHLSGGVKQAGLPSAITAAVYPLALWVGVNEYVSLKITYIKLIILNYNL